jgi:spoIIIJ-associated protein
MPEEANSEKENENIESTTEHSDYEAHNNMVVDIIHDVLEQILNKLGITASVFYQEQAIVQEHERATPPIVFNIKGDELGILIGRRGQSLACLQYLVRLIVSNRTKRSTPIVIDVNGYKQHRYKSLNNLANRIAEEVEANEKSFELEPMPAYERRIIHMALANHLSVITESTGIGEERKVVIIPKKKTDISNT